MECPTKDIRLAKPLNESVVSEPKDLLPEVGIDDLEEPLRAGAARAGWTTLMPVQAMAIPYLLARRDMLIQARTGSGKTGAFLLPMLKRLHILVIRKPWHIASPMVLRS